MIRLWNRVGWYRMVAILLLVGAVAGGSAVAADRQSQQRPTAASQSPQSIADREREARELADLEAERANAERAARRDAQRKADEAAVAAAEQAKSTAPPAPTTKPGKPTTGPPPRPSVPIPASCAAYPKDSNKAKGCALLLAAGYGLDQMGCLEKLWDKESHWNHRALNKSSKAYGIPQALPGIKMASVASDWETNPETQIIWGLGYIKGRYGSPCGAWAHSQRTGWY